MISEDTFISGVRVLDQGPDIMQEMGELKIRGGGFRILLNKMRL